MPLETDEKYGLAEASSRQAFAAPELPYRPVEPKNYRPAIGLIGCGGISVQHLRAYSAAGYAVTALCDCREEKARDAQQKFYPNAQVYTDYRELLKRDDIEVMDLTPHPEDRAQMYAEVIEAGKHILSQKPFVTDLRFGERIAELAEKKGVKLAVNQNGRWAPHFSYMRQAIKAGLLGDILSAHLSVSWNHNWIGGSEYEKMKYLILYDFGIHWFDIVTCFMGTKKPLRVYASTAHTPSQQVKPPLLSQVLIEYEDAQASLSFDADTRYGEQDRTYIAGSKGTISSLGPDLMTQQVTLATPDGLASPVLEGVWFPDGFHGTMAELLCAIEENREPEHSARNNLRSLALCFAALMSAEQHEPVVPGTVHKLVM